MFLQDFKLILGNRNKYKHRDCNTNKILKLHINLKFNNKSGFASTNNVCYDKIKSLIQFSTHRE